MVVEDWLTIEHLGLSVEQQEEEEKEKKQMKKEE